MALALGAEALAVHAIYRGEWSGLFCVGDRQKLPPDLPPPYLFVDSSGYDGQFYRLIAHDPLFRRGFARAVDAPRMRYNRILVPGLASLVAAGDDRLVEPAYLAVMLAFVGLGSFFLARIAGGHQWPPMAGLLFLLVPATLVGLDRMTVDLALAALCLGYAALRPASPAWLATLAAAALCRETGFLLIAAAVFSQIRARDWRVAGLALAAALPALCWYAFVAAHTDPVSAGGYLNPVPFYGLVSRFLHPMQYPLQGWKFALVQIFDYVALAGAAFAWAGLWTLRKNLWSNPELIAFALPFVFISYADVWSEPYAFGRTMTPLWLFLALRGAESGRWICLAPVLLIDARIGLQLASQGLQIAAYFIQP
jgi:hypothetical protein